MRPKRFGSISPLAPSRMEPSTTASRPTRITLGALRPLAAKSESPPSITQSNAGTACVSCDEIMQVSQSPNGPGRRANNSAGRGLASPPSVRGKRNRTTCPVFTAGGPRRADRRDVRGTVSGDVARRGGLPALPHRAADGRRVGHLDLFRERRLERRLAGCRLTAGPRHCARSGTRGHQRGHLALRWRPVAITPQLGRLGRRDWSRRGVVGGGGRARFRRTMGRTRRRRPGCPVGSVSAGSG